MLPHAFVAMPFGKKPGSDGMVIDFNAIYDDLLKPAITAAGLEVFRADEELAAGDIKTDMFQELLIADLVVVDLTIDNPNVWYELGVRHALRARGIVLVQGPRANQPFDIYTDRKYRYNIKDGLPDPTTLESDKAKITEIVIATLESWHDRKISPVFHLLPNLEEPQWKRLKVGDAKEFWDVHDDWEDRIDRARKAQRVGDILVMAEEAPIAAFRSEAHCIAANALLKLERYKFALEYFEHCLKVEPENLEALQKKGICLQRLGELDDARTHYNKILENHPKNSEAWALLGKVEKDAWVETWRHHGTPEQMRDEASFQDALLRTAITSYSTAFSAESGHYYSGINAVTLMQLYRHLTQDTRYNAQIATMSGGVRCAASCEQDPQQAFWAKATLADLEVLAGSPESVISAYKEAIVFAEKNWFALNSTLAQLQLLNDLGFNQEQVNAGIKTFERALEPLKKPTETWQPRQVLLFSGHMVDKPDRETPRFPFDKASIAEAEIAKALDQLGANSDDLAITQGASGGDLIFAEACQKRGVKLQLMQPFPEPEFIERSVAPSEGDWRSRFFDVKAKLTQPTLCMPDELGVIKRNNKTEATSLTEFERCNLWLLNTALAYGPEKVQFICLWDGGVGDGPGGTAHMYNEVKRRTGQVNWLDTRKLW
jgi:tetratricopeptide (TPR) repeat protein